MQRGCARWLAAGPLLLGVSCLAPAGADAVEIALNGGFFEAVAYSATGASSVRDYQTIDSLPVADSVQAVLGGSSLELTYDLSEQSGFAITFAHASEASTGGSTVSTGALDFVPQQDVGFTLTGEYRATDPDGEFVYYSVQLFDFSGGPVAFIIDEIVMIPDASFTVDTSGTLLAGHQYVMNFQFNDGNNTAGGSLPFSSSGFLQLSFVPEPSLALLLALAGMAGVVGRPSRR